MLLTKADYFADFYLSTQVRKAWEGHTIRSSSKYCYILADTSAMISYDGLLVKRSRATLCGCNKLVKLEKKYLLYLDICCAADQG